MMLLKTRTSVLGFTLAVALCAGSSVADAGLLTGWFGPESAVYQPVYATTAYRPVAVASGCNTCAPTTTVMYPTRTAYRQVVAYAPVTTLRPVAACNSCGTQTITMRPVTTYVRRPTYAYRRVYRPMFGGSAYSTGACSTGACSTGACRVPTITNYAPATVSSGCCGTTTNYSSATVVSPVTSYSSTYSSATPTYASPTPAAQTPTTGTPQPDLKSTYQVEPERKTFKKEPAEVEKKDDDAALQPIPQSTGKSSGAGTGIFSRPKIADPKDRTARVFVPRYQVQQAVHVQPVARPRRELSADGWRASGK